MSPLLSNIYLNDLDNLMVRKGYEMVRYADDFVILCQTQEEAQKALAEVQQWTAQAGLTLHPEKTRIAHAATERFEFLGYRFERGRKFPRKKSLKKLRDAIRERTNRTQGQSVFPTPIPCHLSPAQRSAPGANWPTRISAVPARRAFSENGPKSERI